MPLPYNILIVEDNHSEIQLQLEALKQSGLSEIVDVSIARTGPEAVEHIEKVKNAQVVTPDLILLDISLPGINGKDVLKMIKEDPQTKSFRVIVFSNSADDRDLNDCLRLKADCYYQKPDDFRELVTFFESIRGFLKNKSRIAPSNLKAIQLKGLPGLSPFSMN